MKPTGKHIVPCLLCLSLIFLAGCGDGGGSDGGSAGGSINTAPEIISAPERYAKENTSYTYQVSAIDADGDTVSYSLTTAPSGMGIDPSTGLISWTPTSAQGGEHSVEVRASDGKASRRQAYTLAVETTAVVVSQFINKSLGGTIEITDPASELFGAKIVIPPNALPQDSTVSIASVMNPAYVPEKIRVVELSPSMTFSAPVTLILPYTEDFISHYKITDPTHLKVAIFNDEIQQWETVEDSTVDQISKTITARTPHF